jgi:hypothetical protein
MKNSGVVNSVFPVEGIHVLTDHLTLLYTGIIILHSMNAAQKAAVCTFLCCFCEAVEMPWRIEQW